MSLLKFVLFWNPDSRKRIAWHALSCLRLKYQDHQKRSVLVPLQLVQSLNAFFFSIIWKPSCLGGTQFDISCIYGEWADLWWGLFSHLGTLSMSDGLRDRMMAGWSAGEILDTVHLSHVCFLSFFHTVVPDTCQHTFPAWTFCQSRWRWCLLTKASVYLMWPCSLMMCEFDSLPPCWPACLSACLSLSLFLLTADPSEGKHLKGEILQEGEWLKYSWYTASLCFVI